MAHNTPQTFPWWEEKRKGGLLGRIRALSPILIVALVAGAFLFAFSTPPPDPVRTGTNTGFELAANPTTASLDRAAGNPAPPPISLLGSLFGADAVDPFFSVTDPATPPPPIASVDSSEPPDEPQKSIWLYLVAASDIGFETNTSRLGLALATAEQGETDAVNLLIRELEVKLLTYAALVPPPELLEPHRASLSILERYIAHLRASRDKADGSVEITWNNADRTAIADEAARVTQTIRDIVHNSETILPPGVLP